ncbi:VOC family protein [Asanoa siamensis]|nr:VOC family protein [Asanoa siamensis]
MTVHIDVFGVVVADMGRSLAFYRALGLPVPASADTSPHVEVALPGGLRLAFDTIDTIRSFDPTWQAPVGSARTSLAFRCDSPPEVDEVYTRMTTDGWGAGVKPFDAFWGQRYATLHDPDDNAVDLFAALS